MRSFVRPMEVQFDESVNAAVLRIGDVPSAREIVVVPITLENDTVGTVTFDTSGRLVQIELLDARVQLGMLLPHE